MTAHRRGEQGPPAGGRSRVGPTVASVDPVRVEIFGENRSYRNGGSIFGLELRVVGTVNDDDYRD